MRRRAGAASPSNHRAKITTRLRIIAAEAAETRALPIYFKNSQNQRQPNTL
jgi:hypothetical protein